MSCCGKKRSNAGSISVATAVSAVPVPAGMALRPLQFEYLGGSVLTVTGQGTGLQYRFVGYGARASVDPRDRTSLARVPQLREVIIAMIQYATTPG
jgi:hypothetical protein